MKTSYVTANSGNEQSVKEKPLAILTIYGAGKMTSRQIAAIAKWLEKQAEGLRNDGSTYSEGRFTARYFGTRKAATKGSKQK